MEMPSFVIPAATGGTPDSVNKRRRMAELMLASGMQAEPIRHWSQGANKIAQALIGGLGIRRAEGMETEGRKGANAALVKALQGGDQSALMEAINNPWQSEAGGKMAYDQWQQMQPGDPNAQEMERLKLEKMRAEVAQLQNPQANTEAGLNLVYWKDQNGQLHAGQPLKGGGMKEVPLPEGGQWAPGMGYLDTGTGFTPYDKRAGAMPEATIPKDIAGVETQKAIGFKHGEQIASAPGDISAADNAIALIDNIANDPNRAWGTGGSSVLNFIPGTPGKDFQLKVNQATSGAFLTAIQQMRGLGALSNAEGQTATAAITRMNTAASEGAFMEALSDYRKIAETGRARAASRLPSGGNPMPTQEQPQPQLSAPVDSAPLQFNPSDTDLLKADPSPEAMREFDEVYGPGAAQKALGGQ